MKNLVAFLFLLFIGNYSPNMLFAQNYRQPLTGNGKEKTTRQPLKSFTQLEVLWLDGKIEVEFGAAQSDIEITTDENIFNLLKINNNTEGVLSLEIEGNVRNRLWLEDDKTRIKIRSTAQPSTIIYKANADATIRGLKLGQNTVTPERDEVSAERHQAESMTKGIKGVLNIEKTGNGNLTLAGEAYALNITQDDNGSTDAEALIVTAASVRKKGNGALSLNAGKLEKSSVSGNGGFFNANDAPLPKVKRVNVTFFNPNTREKTYYVTGKNERGATFSYGLSLKGMEKQAEYLPIGTEIYLRGRLVTRIEEKNDGQIVNL